LLLAYLGVLRYMAGKPLDLPPSAADAQPSAAPLTGLNALAPTAGA